MTPDLTITIKANPALTTHDAVLAYIDDMIVAHHELLAYRNALVDVVNTRGDDRIEVYSIPDMDGDYVSSTNGTHLLWMPAVCRAAINAWQSGDWQWTDASSPEDALRRYQQDDMLA